MTTPTRSNGAKTHTYADGDANRAITVDLTDEDGTFLDRANAKSVSVDNVAPSIAISGATNVNEGSVYTLTLGAVTDPGTDTVTDYVVHWGDGNTSHYATSGAKTHTYADGPTHPRDHGRPDRRGRHLRRPREREVGHVDNVAPSIAISGNANVNEGSVYTLTLGAVTDPGTDTVTDYVVHWGDGNTSHYATNGAKTHTYADGPTPTTPITVDLVDEDGTFLDRANAKSVTRRQRRAVDRDQRRGERGRGLGLQPDSGRGYRSGHGHGHELRRSLGRRQLEHLLVQRRQDAHLRRRPQRLARHGRSGRRGRHVPRPRQRALGACRERRSDRAPER